MLLQKKKANEVVVSLGTVEIGKSKAFRFAHMESHEAMAEGTFYMVVKPWSGDKRPHCVSLDGQECRIFDSEHRVIVHDFDIVLNY